MGRMMMWRQRATKIRPKISKLMGKNSHFGQGSRTVVYFDDDGGDTVPDKSDVDLTPRQPVGEKTTSNLLSTHTPYAENQE